MRSSLAAALVHCLALVLSGCSTATPQNARLPTVAIAIVPVNVSTVTADQVARIQQALKPELQRAGYTLAENGSASDLVLTVTFTPVPGSPGGSIKVAKLEPTNEFRHATSGTETPESREWRRLQRDLQSAAERQGLHPESP